MHHVVVEHWARRRSVLHSRDARAKFLALLAFLVAVATNPAEAQAHIALFAAILAAAIGLSRLPPLAVLLRAAAILPFSVTFAAVSWLAGDPARAAALVEKSYLSAAAVLVLVGTTPLPNLLRALESLGTPRLLILVIQFLYRYLFVISEQAQHMRLAAQCRSASGRSRLVRRSRFRAAAGALSVLFARSYLRAEGIHRAMIARGFSGRFPLLAPPRFRFLDLLLVAIAVALSAAARYAL